MKKNDNFEVKNINDARALLIKNRESRRERVKIIIGKINSSQKLKEHEILRNS